MKRMLSRAASHRASERRLLAWVLTASSLAGAQNLASDTTAQSSTHPIRQVLVSIPDRKLAVLENGRVLRTFPVAVGAPVSPSPAGRFVVANRISNPTYYRPGVVIPAGSGNPIGPRWIGLNQKGVGIHGTNEPRSIGHAASHGCIRLRNQDVEQLFAMVRVGDVVEIRAERDQAIAQIFGGTADENAAGVTQASAESGAQAAEGQ